MSEKYTTEVQKNVQLTTPLSCADISCYSFLPQPITTTTEDYQNRVKSVWCNEYFSDILDSLKESEKRRQRMDYKSKQTSFRPSLLMLMKTAADSMFLGRTTLHLAVFILDCFMDTYTIIIDKLNASALMCLLIAAKIEEPDQNLPKHSKFNALVGDVYSTQDFNVVEKKIVSSFKYDFIYPTAATFVESYSNQLVSHEDFLHHSDHSSNGTQLAVFPNIESMILETTSLLFNILDVSLNDYRLVNCTPSVIGAACLAVTRALRKIEPVWTQRLVTLTGYHYVVIEPYADALEALYAIYANKESVCDSPDSGIASDSRSDSEDDYDDVDYNPAIKRRRIF